MPDGVSCALDLSECSIGVSDAPDEPVWDDFLEHVPSGHHMQTSCWGRARAPIGWQPSRLLVRQGDRVMGGAQVVTRRMLGGLNVGFVSRGPVLETDDPHLLGAVLDEMLAVGRARKMQYLVVQPPRGCDWMREELERRGFRYGAFDIHKRATVRIDLGQDTDALAKRMSRQCRQNIRTAEKRGITVRRGSAADLPVFHRLKDAHSARLGYQRRNEPFYDELWRAFAGRGNIRLFIAEYEGEPVSAMLSVAFGETWGNKERPWSGAHAERRPNELLEWEVIKSAKAEGYRYADMEGIEFPVAEAVLSGSEIPSDPRYSASRFKLKFGGEIVVDPPAFDYVYNPVLRSGYRCIPNGVMRSDWMNDLILRMRDAETGS